MKLQYQTPAKAWTEAVPIGNRPARRHDLRRQPLESFFMATLRYCEDGIRISHELNFE